MTAQVLVGACGFSEDRQRLFRDLDAIEVRQSFYHPPRVATAARWRCEAPDGFVFTLKAWQIITHPCLPPPASAAERSGKAPGRILPPQQGDSVGGPMASTV